MMWIIISQMVHLGCFRRIIGQPTAWQQKRHSGLPVQTFQEEIQNLEAVGTGPHWSELDSQASILSG